MGVRVFLNEQFIEYMACACAWQSARKRTGLALKDGSKWEIVACSQRDPSLRLFIGRDHHITISKLVLQENSKMFSHNSNGFARETR